MNLNEDIEIQEKTGWYAAHDDDLVFKTDKQYRVGGETIVHVLEKDPIEDCPDVSWYHDCENHDATVMIYPTRGEAKEAEIERRKKALSNREYKRQDKMAKDQAIINDLKADRYDGWRRLRNIVEGYDQSFRITHKDNLERIEELDEMIRLIKGGGVTMRDKDNEQRAFIPLGSIDIIVRDKTEGGAVLVTRCGDKFPLSEKEYRVIELVLSVRQ